MSKRHRRVRDEQRKAPRELDWFGEDPWEETEPLELDDFEQGGNDEDWFIDLEDSWAPIRPRRRQGHSGP